MFTGSDHDAGALVELISRAAAGLHDPPWSHGYELTEADASTGYNAVANAYDRAEGPDIDVELVPADDPVRMLAHPWLAVAPRGNYWYADGAAGAWTFDVA